MRSFFVILTLLMISYSLSAQDSLRNQIPLLSQSEHHDIYFGLTRGPKVDSLDATYTSIEFGYAKSFVTKGMHGGSLTLYLGQALGLTQRNLIHGTKVGVWTSLTMFTFGMELAHQTDYKRHAFNFWPSLGIGSYPFQLSIAPRVRLSGKSFQPQNKVRINLSFALFRLKKKEITITPGTG